MNILKQAELKLSIFDVSFFKKSIIPTLTIQQKKILTIVLCALSLLTLCFCKWMARRASLKPFEAKVPCKVDFFKEEAKTEKVNEAAKPVLQEKEGVSPSKGEFEKIRIKIEDEVPHKTDANAGLQISYKVEDKSPIISEIAKDKTENETLLDKAEDPPIKLEVEALYKFETDKPNPTDDQAVNQPGNDSHSIKSHNFKIINEKDYPRYAEAVARIKELYTCATEYSIQQKHCDGSNSLADAYWGLKQNQVFLAVKKEEDTIIGFLCLRDCEDGFRIYHLTVDRSFAIQEKGAVETELMLQAMSKVKQLGSNTVCVQFGGWFCNPCDPRFQKKYNFCSDPHLQKKIDFCKTFTKFNISVEQWEEDDGIVKTQNVSYDLTNFQDSKDVNIKEGKPSLKRKRHFIDLF